MLSDDSSIRINPSQLKILIVSCAVSRNAELDKVFGILRIIALSTSGTVEEDSPSPCSNLGK
jgi:hypothetical protein